MTILTVLLRDLRAIVPIHLFSDLVLEQVPSVLRSACSIQRRRERLPTFLDTWTSECSGLLTDVGHLFCLQKR